MTKTNILYEMNTVTYLNSLSDQLGHAATLADIPQNQLQQLEDMGIGIVWLMGVWQRSPRAIEIGMNDPDLQTVLKEALPDIKPTDQIGSAYSIRGYQINESLGGEIALASLRTRLNQYGIKLMLDFVPNHTAPDHPWTHDHSDYYISGTTEELSASSENYLDCNGTILAKGKDPSLIAWSDVVQLDAFSSGYRQVAIDTLINIAELCDGVRCDMAMLMLNDIFTKTWGDKAGPVPSTEYWQEVISAVRLSRPDFIFLAEAYWDTEQTLLSQGFDYCYDKTLYDRLCEGGSISDHLAGSASYQSQLAHFIENHDEPRAAAVLPPEKEMAAAVIIATLPGLAFFYDGQFEGNKIKIPVHLARRPDETPNIELKAFYTNLLSIVKSWNLSSGDWQIIQASHENVVTMQWKFDDHTIIVVVNYSDQPIESSFPWPGQPDQKNLNFIDSLSGEIVILPTEIVDSQTVIHCNLGPWQSFLLTDTPRRP
ncbi:MAG: alpha-amylase family glycosyl hydrolase [Candidatus Saccharimonadales bacterium]